MNAEITTKYVYRPSATGEYFRIEKGNVRTLKQDFYYVGVAFDSPYTIRVYFLHKGHDATAWKDKYCNVIVRYVLSYKQTIIDF